MDIPEYKDHISSSLDKVKTHVGVGQVYAKLWKACEEKFGDTWRSKSSDNKDLVGHTKESVCSFLYSVPLWLSFKC